MGVSPWCLAVKFLVLWAGCYRCWWACSRNCSLCWSQLSTLGESVGFRILDKMAAGFLGCFEVCLVAVSEGVLHNLLIYSLYLAIGLGIITRSLPYRDPQFFHETLPDSQHDLCSLVIHDVLWNVKVPGNVVEYKFCHFEGIWKISQ